MSVPHSYVDSTGSLTHNQCDIFLARSLGLVGGAGRLNLIIALRATLQDAGVAGIDRGAGACGDAPGQGWEVTGEAEHRRVDEDRSPRREGTHDSARELVRASYGRFIEYLGRPYGEAIFRQHSGLDRSRHHFEH